MSIYSLDSFVSPYIFKTADIFCRQRAFTFGIFDVSLADLYKCKAAYCFIVDNGVNTGPDTGGKHKMSI